MDEMSPSGEQLTASRNGTGVQWVPPMSDCQHVPSLYRLLLSTSIEPVIGELGALGERSKREDTRCRPIQRLAYAR